MAKFNVEVFSCISAGALLRVDVGYSMRWKYRGRVVYGNVGFSRVRGHCKGLMVCEGGDCRGAVEGGEVNREEVVYR